MLFKNIASQKLAVYAYDTDADAPETGDAANITCEISIDGGASAAVGDTNPTELDATDHPGIYIFDLTQAETNGDMLIFSPVSATANIHIEPVIVYTGGGVFSDGSGTRVGSAGAATGLVRGQDTDSLDDVADAVRAEMDSDSTQLAAIIADTGTDIPALIAALNDFDPNAETVTTDAASREASKADVSGLSTFDPAADTVARVTLVDTVTENTDMRGTDSALTDKAGFALSASGIDGIWDEALGDTTITMRQCIQVSTCILAAIASGGGTTQLTFRTLADDGDILVETVDANGNRTEVTLNPTV